jgi:hypothetical protein
MATVLQAVAKQVDLDPAELEALKAAAEAGARAGVLAAQDDLALAIAANLTGQLGITPEQAQDAAARALRDVLGGLDRPATG